MKYRVIFSPEAENQLAELFRYIAEAASPGIAERYINAIIIYCESLDEEAGRLWLNVGRGLSPCCPASP